MSNRSKRLDEIRAEAELFFEWPGDDRSTVTLTSCILFADHITAQSPAQGVPDGLPLVLAGVLFDFAGFLTTRPQVIEVGATANASPMADLVKEFATMRGLSLADAAVLSWQELLAAPSAPAAQGWIPVSEGLPERATDVLVYGINNGSHSYTVAGLFSGSWASQETEEATRFEPTHWMPLPKSPEKSGVIDYEQ